MPSIRRGDLVTVALPGDFGKPRPALIVQSDFYNPTHPTVTVLPLTSDRRDVPLFRIDVRPSPENGLRRDSQIMGDKPMTYLREKIGPPFGRLDEATLRRVNGALTVWLAVA